MLVPFSILVLSLTVTLAAHVPDTDSSVHVVLQLGDAMQHLLRGKRGGEMVSSFLRGRKADQLTQLLRGKKSVLSGGDTLDDGGEFQVAEDDDANTVKRSNNLNHFLRGRRSGGGNLNHFLRGRRADLDHLFRGRRGQGDMNHLFRGRRFDDHLLRGKKSLEDYADEYEYADEYY